MDCQLLQSQFGKTFINGFTKKGGDAYGLKHVIHGDVDLYQPLSVRSVDSQVQKENQLVRKLAVVLSYKKKNSKTIY